MKFNLNLGEIKIGDMTINGAGVSFECSVKEMTGSYELTKRIIKEAPELLNDIAQAVKTMDELDRLDRLDDKFRKAAISCDTADSRHIDEIEKEMWQDDSECFDKKEEECLSYLESDKGHNDYVDNFEREMREYMQCLKKGIIKPSIEV